MDISDLNFIYTDTLLPYEERLKGTFVYLKNDYNEYSKGVYFYGENEIEKLTNDIFIPALPENNVQLPEFNDIEYVYNGIQQTIIPSNWNDIEDYVYIFGNTRTNAGTYTITLMLKYINLSWIDGTSEPKEYEFTIQRLHVSSDNVRIVLDNDNYEIGQLLPQVSKVVYLKSDNNETELTLNKDYIVETNKDSNNIKVTFINNYEGVVYKRYNVSKKEIDDPYLKPFKFTYTGKDIKIFPTNWNDIKDFCEISGNINTEIGEYYFMVSLKNPDFYCWKTKQTSETYIIKYEIEHISVPVPIWNDENKYNVTYTGKDYTFLPSNWNEIKEFVNISENTFNRVGEYNITLSLKENGYKWSDDTLEDKKFTCVINKFIIDLPVWRDATVGEYTGNEIYYRPINWDNISKYCSISGHYAVNVGEYQTIVSLNDPNNYGWKLLTDIITSDDQIKNWRIIAADGYFKQLPYLTGNYYVGEKISCIAVYVDNTCDLKYFWYRNSSPSIVGAEYITETKNNEYVLQLKDIEKYIICEVVAKSYEGISNYKGNKSIATSIMRVQKTIIYNGIKFKNDVDEESTNIYSPIFQIPEVEGIISDDTCHLEYTVTQGSDIGDFTEKNSNVLLLNNKVGDIIVEVKVTGSEKYIYIPDTLKFTLHVYSSNVILWGLYDKNGNPNEKQMLEDGIIPETSQVAVLKENHEGIHSLLFRKNYPYRTENGDEQVYYGWYVLLPIDNTMKSLNENHYSSMDIDGLLMKDENGKPKIITSKDKKEYKLYCKFNVGKMSDNWMLHILFK